MLKESVTAIRVIVLLLFIVSGIYPLALWAISQTVFHYQANGSLITNAKGAVVGSELLGQSFTRPEYFQPRPSAAGNGYDPTASGGTNLGPTNDQLTYGIHKKLPDGKNDPSNFDGARDLAAAYRAENGLPINVPVPVDAVTRSGSGLDPHISEANAALQTPRVAKARGVSEDVVEKLVADNTQGRQLGFLGEPVVNVLELNLALDKSVPLKTGENFIRPRSGEPIWHS